MSKASLATGSGPVVNPVGGSIWPVSIFWSFIDIGTPAQKFPVAIDSGSFTLNVPTKGCQGCITKAPNNQYDASASSTSQSYPCSFGGCSVGSCSNGQCSYSNTYETCDPTDPSQPCSISGPFYSDVVSWGEAGPVNVTFGGISDQTAGFYQFATVDGVCGMASPSGSQSVFGQLVAQGAVPARGLHVQRYHLPWRCRPAPARRRNEVHAGHGLRVLPDELRRHDCRRPEAVWFGRDHHHRQRHQRPVDLPGGLRLVEAGHGEHVLFHEAGGRVRRVEDPVRWRLLQDDPGGDCHVPELHPLCAQHRPAHDPEGLLAVGPA